MKVHLKPEEAKILCLVFLSNQNHSKVHRVILRCHCDSGVAIPILHSLKVKPVVQSPNQCLLACLLVFGSVSESDKQRQSSTATYHPITAQRGFAEQPVTTHRGISGVRWMLFIGHY